MLEKLSNLPTPLQIISDPVSLIIITIFFGLLIAEELFPGRPLPRVRYWKLKGICAFIIFFFLSSYLPLIWNDYFAKYSIIDLSVLGDYWGALLALVVYELGVYVWHRSMHKSNVLWRVFHQMHHSAERVDTYGTFFFSTLR